MFSQLKTVVVLTNVAPATSELFVDNLNSKEPGSVILTWVTFPAAVNSELFKKLLVLLGIEIFKVKI